MSVETDPVPPVPEHTPPLKEDEHNPQIGKYFNHVWTRWFVSLREKINVLNSSLVTLGEVTGTGILVKNGAAWVLRTLTGTDDRVTVTDGDGASGNPTVDVVTADLVAGTNVTFTGSGVDRIIDNGSGDLTVNATGGGSAGYLYTNPAFSLVSALLHFDGANGSTTFTDQVVGNVWTPTNATISTAQSVFGGASGLFTGTGNSRIQCPTSNIFDIGAGDWTLEFRIFPNGTHQTSARIFQTRTGDVYGAISLTLNAGSGNNVMRLDMSSNGTSFNILAGAVLATLNASTFNRIILQRRNNIISCFHDDLLVYSNTIAATPLYYNAADTIIIGGQAGTSRSINAYLDELRFTKGAYVLSLPLNAPTTPFPNS